MFLWTGPNPGHDSDFDTEIVLHEYVHGLSDRLVGGGVGLWALQSWGLGEGWSDWYPLALLSEPGDDMDCGASRSGRRGPTWWPSTASPSATGWSCNS